MPCIEEDIVPTSELEDRMYVHIILDEGEIVKPNDISEKSSELPYQNKDAGTEISECDRVLNALKKLDTL